MRYLISDLAKLLSVTTNTIRRYEKSGFLKPKRDTANYRWYEYYDIAKANLIRLYIKCGFSHNAVKEMLDNSSGNIEAIYKKRLDEIDAEMERLKRLRHWLKDNIQLLNTIKALKQDYIITDCPELKYVEYCVGDELLSEKARLQTIKYFMYDAPEVQMLYLFKLKDIKKGKFIPHCSWAVKTKDIEKFNMVHIVDDNRYIDTYSSVKCLYGYIEISQKDIYNEKKVNEEREKYLVKSLKYAYSNGYEICGDMADILVSGLGDTVSMLVCYPIKSIE